MPPFAYKDIYQVCLTYTAISEWLIHALCKPEQDAVLKACSVQAAVQGRPGAAYVDIPSDVLMASSSSSPLMPSLKQPDAATCSGQDLQRAVQLLQQAQR